jgi:hypothetical protein
MGVECKSLKCSVRRSLYRSTGIYYKYKVYTTYGTHMSISYGMARRFDIVLRYHFYTDDWTHDRKNIPGAQSVLDIAQRVGSLPCPLAT